MDATILVVARVRDGSVALPRRVRMTLVPGSGALRVVRAPPLDGAWMASVEQGWRAARLLSGRNDMDAELSVDGAAPLAGGSAGLPVGLLALRALLEDDAPDAAFATGHVLDALGFLMGGDSARVKGEAAASIAREAGRGEAMLVAPPLAEPPEVPGLRVVEAADLGSAYGLVRPGSYRRIEERHRAARRVEAPSGAHTSPSGDARVAILSVVEDGLLLWQTIVDANAPRERVERLAEAARRASLR